MSTHGTQLPQSGGLVQAADGSRWRTADHAPDGEQLYVLNGVNPTTCARWVRARESELVELVGELTPVVDLVKGGVR
ncbi:hypothetical protein SLA_2386 [Streptomyces laurentii]|uniref:Uncharacterized protein n=1 Tax=Streptomyces laurentii TaxID=39478 RepID=A0A160NZC9_STRLU|nr:hypothetical protein SLA_2386 [Streptomyces laurentii]